MTLSEQEPEASVPEVALPEVDPGLPDPGRTEVRAGQPPPEIRFKTERDD